MTNDSGSTDDIKQWMATRRAALVVNLLPGAILIAEAARRYELTIAAMERWQKRCLNGSENVLRSHPR